jgi:hypothetical protein
MLQQVNSMQRSRGMQDSMLRLSSTCTKNYALVAESNYYLDRGLRVSHCQGHLHATEWCCGLWYFVTTACNQCDGA